MTFTDWMEVLVRGFEAVGVLVLTVGSVWALARAGWSWLRGERETAFSSARRAIGKSILLGLEILIIADIIQTITIDPNLENALALGIIVLVRTFLSFSLEIELDGVLPWRRGHAAP